MSRKDILRQAELAMEDLGSPKTLLEIQYENEVGSVDSHGASREGVA